ncbi:anaerobic ribonucleoside-triphosphate reductase activating protein [Candidatus Uhrbacteria bacterium]|nr:anaerobic ribonucleoside-triphosphate reductase activating protein [Candidatus Uhrbacteria bacterium]
MLISGIQPFTILDFPDRIACIVFTLGCNFRCGYCHNPEFVLPEKVREMRTAVISEDTFFRFLSQRKNLLEGVVISGGEPTIHQDLVEFILRIKKEGFLVKLDTNGSNPEVVQNLLDQNLLDYIAMDVKTSKEQYQSLVGRGVPAIEKTISLIRDNGVPYEFRCTLLRELHPPSVLASMAQMMHGARRVYLQQFRSQTTLDPLFESYHAFTQAEMEGVKEIFAPYCEEVFVR